MELLCLSRARIYACKVGEEGEEDKWFRCHSLPCPALPCAALRCAVVYTHAGSPRVSVCLSVLHMHAHVPTLLVVVAHTRPVTACLCRTCVPAHSSPAGPYTCKQEESDDEEEGSGSDADDESEEEEEQQEQGGQMQAYQGGGNGMQVRVYVCVNLGG